MLLSAALSTPVVAFGAPATPASVPAVACTAQPRSYDQFAALLADQSIATPAAATGGLTIPEGTPASAAETSAMEKLALEWLSCQNAGEQLRAWSLFSDGYLHRLLSRQGILSAEAYVVLATPSPSDGPLATLHELRGTRHLPDGRMGATIVVAYPSVPMPKTFFVYFIEEDNELVIDGILGEISFSVP